MSSPADSDAFLQDLDLSAEDPLEFFPSEHQIVPGYGRRGVEAVIRGFAALVAACRSGWRFAATRLRLSAARVSTWRFPVSRLPRWRLSAWPVPAWRLPGWRAAVSRGPVWNTQALRGTVSTRIDAFASNALAAAARLSSHGGLSTITISAFACGVVVGGCVVWLAGASARADAKRTPPPQPLRSASRTPGSQVVSATQQVLGASSISRLRPTPPARSNSVAAAPGPRPVAPAPSSAATASLARASAVTSSAAASSAGKSSPRPFRGALIVNSLPSGARVLLNGRAVGTTPLVLRDQPAGSRAIQIALEGFEPWSAAVQVVAYTETRLRAELKQRRQPVER